MMNNHRKTTTTLLSMPTCSVCGKISRSDHGHCARFAEMRRWRYARFAILFKGFAGINPKEAENLLGQYMEARDVRGLIRFLRDLHDIIGQDEHARNATLDEMIVDFEGYCNIPAIPQHSAP